uniref:Uncharacterized protein n=1 Tax=Amphora coffeiformis TaxID=265554 RepID=A0A7S3P7X4_9STRA|mmetsp:Transcript_18189/g.34515  ORF Transcript_18189/g.34515 Transcript_18189/m.34515 type:complete len:188 (+) Transcript_18189:75-638(+)|eukprot:scaffold1267_cov171-Amphora_coffeaeformis.AAC.10
MKVTCILFFVALVRSSLAFVSPSVGVHNNNDVASAARALSTRPLRVERQAPPPCFEKTRKTLLLADPSSSGEENKSKLPFFLDPGTKGGALFLSLVLFVIPIIFYNIILAVSSDIDELDLGRWIGVGFTAVATLAWLGTYLFRVVTKDMTYAKQLKDYENAVIAKRLEELDEDELQALVEEVDKDDF